jgi:hypothetical protein
MQNAQLSAVAIELFGMICSSRVLDRLSSHILLIISKQLGHPDLGMAMMRFKRANIYGKLVERIDRTVRHPDKSTQKAISAAAVSKVGPMMPSTSS